MLSKNFLVGTATFATGGWHPVPPSQGDLPPRVSFELLRLRVVDFSNNLHHGQTSGRGASGRCWPSTKGRRSSSDCSLAPQHLGGIPPAPAAQLGEGRQPSPPPDSRICWALSGRPWVADRLSKCSDSGCLPQRISQPSRDLQTSAGSGIILALMT